MRLARRARTFLTVATATLLAGGAWFATVPGAYAADHDNELVVSVPSLPPTPPPSSPPPSPPPSSPPPSSPPPSSPPPSSPPASSGEDPRDEQPGGVPAAGAPAPRGSATNAPRGGSTDDTTDDAVACTPTEPAVPAQPASGADEATVDKDVYRVGEEITATATGFGPQEQVQLVLFSEPGLIGSFTADDDGTVRATFPVSEKTPPGPHTLQFTGWCDGVATAAVLVGSAGSAADAEQGIPAWFWWVGGALLVPATLWAGWYVVRLMRAPGPEAAVAS
ncbi:hypothetical protein [Microbacterium album]|uniref:Uncharacterized protein n=1 Tax=Microbacterium album TaxID=2053191 RepID=A0A917MNK8_9MICO|nr:hypothetical protein [Microbacterium album]GGH49859.1 hypothetical protein GCM10010921_28230 [Microbacterium album]